MDVIKSYKTVSFMELTPIEACLLAQLMEHYCIEFGEIFNALESIHEDYLFYIENPFEVVLQAILMQLCGDDVEFIGDAIQYDKSSNRLEVHFKYSDFHELDEHIQLKLKDIIKYANSLVNKKSTTTLTEFKSTGNIKKLLVWNVHKM